MHEILYIQAGKTSNYFGTHFWNTQQSYFTYDHLEEDISFVDHDVSWREGYSQAGHESTYCPRLLLFDHKSNFGTLAQHNDFYPQHLEEDLEEPVLWAGPVEQHRQSRIAHKSFDSTADNTQTPEASSKVSVGIEPPRSSEGAKGIRYWSDYNQVIHIPRSIHRLPDPLETGQPGWNSSRYNFSRYDKDMELVDTSLRAFLEECDTLQGIVMSLDTVTFGGFGTALLDGFREEYPKHAIHCNMFHSDLLETELQSPQERIQFLSNAMALSSLNDLECLVVPYSITSASDFAAMKAASSEEVPLYTSTAILSALHESATSPSRLRDPLQRRSLASISALLNWRGDNRICNLTGAFLTPLSSLSTLEAPDFLHQFSSRRIETEEASSEDYFASHVVARGILQVKHRSAVDTWVSDRLRTASDISYIPMPTSPTSFDFVSSYLSKGAKEAEPTIPIFSTLSTTSKAAMLLRKMANSVEALIRQKSDHDVDEEDLVALKDSLWTMHDGYDVIAEEDDNIGEDEI